MELLSFVLCECGNLGAFRALRVNWFIRRVRRRQPSMKAPTPEDIAKIIIQAEITTLLWAKSSDKWSTWLVADWGRIDRREGAILGVVAVISQNLDAIRTGQRQQSLSLLGGIVEWGINISCLWIYRDDDHIGRCLFRSRLPAISRTELDWIGAVVSYRLSLCSETTRLLP